MPGTPSERDEVLATLPAEVGRRLDVFVGLLLRWQATINLVAPSTLPHVWARHVGDSMQVQAAVPTARRWVDLGSGGGFPGLVTALVLMGKPDAVVHLVESDKRKAAFLRTVVRETEAPASVRAERIDRFVSTHRAPVDAVSARALAPLPQLIQYARPLLENGAVGVFPQGETAVAELTGLGADRRFAVESVPSRMRHGSRLLIVRAEVAGSLPRSIAED